MGGKHINLYAASCLNRVVGIVIAPTTLLLNCIDMIRFEILVFSPISCKVRYMRIIVFLSVLLCPFSAWAGHLPDALKHFQVAGEVETPMNDEKVHCFYNCTIEDWTTSDKCYAVAGNCYIGYCVPSVPMSNLASCKDGDSKSLPDAKPRK